MSRRSGQFAAAVLALSLAVPGLLIVLGPFAEARSTLGTAVGWSLALLIMVPSYVLLARADETGDAQAFIRGFMLGTLMRLVVTAGATALFVLLVEPAPIKSFLLAFFLGYVLLTTLELTLTLRKPGERTSA